MRDPSLASSTVEAAEEAIRQGDVVAVATDTVFGLVCDPANEVAVARIYTIKQRPDGLELTVLAAGADQLDELIEWSPQARRLAAAFWPGPLSLVMPVGRVRLAIPRRGSTLSVRVPDHDQVRQLLRRTGPLASTSANRHGRTPAMNADQVWRQFGDEVACVLGGGSPLGVASTIIDCSRTPPRMLREGPITESDLSRMRRAPTSRPPPENSGRNQTE